MRLPRLFRRPVTRTQEFEAAARRRPSTCAICGRPATQGHDNAAHDAHMASRTVTPVPVDGKPVPTPERPACVVCATNGAPGTRRQWQAHMDHTIADERDRYWRDVEAMAELVRKADALKVIRLDANRPDSTYLTKGETA